MTRRQALLALLAMPMGFFTAYRANAAAQLGTAHLRIPLDQWSGVTIEFNGQHITYTPRELFTILKEK